MMRSALNAIDAHSETTAMIGDRMDTDIVAGLEAGPGDRPRPDRRHAARARSSASRTAPSRMVESVADLVPEVAPATG